MAIERSGRLRGAFEPARIDEKLEARADEGRAGPPAEGVVSRTRSGLAAAIDGLRTGAARIESAVRKATAGAPAAKAPAAAAAPAAAPRGAAVRAPDLGTLTPIDVAFGKTGPALFQNKPPFRAPIEDHRSAAAAAKAVATPLAVPAGGAKPFGPTAVIRPAFANTPTSAAFVFRAAQYTDRLLVAYSNAKPGQDLTPRPVDEIYGVKVPPELRGKIFVSGDPSPHVAPYDKLAGLFEAQLDALEGSAFLRGGAVDGANLTVLAYSAGGVDAAETRRRLEAKGRTQVFGKLVNVSSPIQGAPIADEPFSGKLGRALGLVGGRLPAAARKLDPDVLKKAFPPADRRLVDLAVSNSIHGGEGSKDVHPAFKALNKAFKLHPFNPSRREPNDGWVNRSSQEYGRDVLRLSKSYDHAGVGADPAVIDEIAKRLAGTG